MRIVFRVLSGAFAFVAVLALSAAVTNSPAPRLSGLLALCFAIVSGGCWTISLAPYARRNG